MRNLPGPCLFTGTLVPMYCIRYALVEIRLCSMGRLLLVMCFYFVICNHAEMFTVPIYALVPYRQFINKLLPNVCIYFYFWLIWGELWLKLQVSEMLAFNAAWCIFCLWKFLWSIFDACQLSGILLFSMLAMQRILIKSDHIKLSFCASHAVSWRWEFYRYVWRSILF